ncbi:WD40 repeat protein [Caldalkalibacillus uzonensis]|uniref:WD40 repeat protein n=1 Tax=Caldalkalibacillus uzonensis TaxID=353224 RepID=A0ABU0CQ86_9BACI|nr:carbohydrate binding domain-containing protein [Caldalkalibacillus uzonensis]MDQ0338561.1 WD40 repeat protein [Caldalkalibacillus uzonensis]
MVNKLKFLFTVAVIILLGTVIFFGTTDSDAPYAASEMIDLKNPGFEESLNADGTIPGWRVAYGSDDNFVVTDELSHSGDYSLKLMDESSERSAGLISDPVPVEAQKMYRASSYIYIQQGTLSLYLRFYDSEGRQLEQTSASIASPKEEWIKLEVSATAPEDAASAAILLYSNVVQISTAYFDDISLEMEEMNQDGEFINLGTQVRNVTNHYADFGIDENGRHVVYTGVVGDPAKLIKIDVETEQILKIFDLPGASGVRGVAVASDGSVYAGTYTNGHLYRYIPGSDGIEDLGKAVGETHIFNLEPGPNGEVYGGTYSATAGAKLFKYHPDSGFTDYGRILETERYVRTVVYDDKQNIFYLGIGSTPHIIKFNPETGEKKDILPDKYKEGYTFVDNITKVNDYLFAKLVQGNKTLVIDTKTDEVVNEIEKVDSFTVSPQSPYGEEVYYTLGAKLYKYDLNTHESKDLDLHVNGNPLKFKFLELQEEGPGYTLVALVRRGMMFKYNLETGHLKTIDLDLPGQPTDIWAMAKGPDGRIYTNGYLAGGLSYYDPLTGETHQYDGIGQIEKMDLFGDTFYLGGYPRAEIYAYDTTKPWVRDATAKEPNPRQLFSLYDLGQDRPMAVLAVEEENKVFLGTVPAYGQHQGALTIYNVETGDVRVEKNIIENQGVVSLAYKDGHVFGGTTIWGGLGDDPLESEAKFFIWDVEIEEKIYETTPVPGMKAITDLIVGPDGNIWGMAEGTLFIFDPEERKVVYSDEKFTLDYDRHVWRDAFLEIGRDGNVYGTIRGRFFKIDAQSKEVTVLKGSGASRIAQDDFGNFYFADGGDLWKYTHPDLQMTGFDALVIKTELYYKNGKLEKPLYAQLEKTLEQAKHHQKAGRLEQFEHRLMKFKEHLNKESMQKFISTSAKEDLNQEVDHLLQIGE